MKFSTLEVNHWRQFKEVSLRFADQVTILTGRNGTGKTTILNILAQHSKYFTSFVASPSQARDSAGRFLSGLWEDYVREGTDQIGRIGYADGSTSEIRVEPNVAVSFSPQIIPEHPVPVLYIPSHRRLAAYKRVESIPTLPVTDENALSSYQSVFWTNAKGETTRSTPLTQMKEAIVSMAAFGPGNSVVAPNEESYAILVDFEHRLRKLIPANIGFQRIRVQIPDVIIETDSGRFLIDASSGGLMSLIDLAWQITLYGRRRGNFVVCIDEPENHLHPSMQREVLPALVEAFPNAQFVVATHSPFVVSSIRDAAVYAFDVDREDASASIADDLSGSRSSVVAVSVDISDRTSSGEVLRQVLGVPVSVPIWAEKELDEVLEQFKDGEFSPEQLRELQVTLSARGLDEFLPDVVARAYEKKNAKADKGS